MEKMDLKRYSVEKPQPPLDKDTQVRVYNLSLKIIILFLKGLEKRCHEREVAVGTPAESAV
jgi:hypothetical protein